MSKITIPPEALEAAAMADFEAWRKYHHRTETWDDLLPEEQESYRVAARAACLAMLEAWPGMGTVATEDHTGIWPKIILPLPQENSNEQE